jgi:hypothetical protein
MNLLWLVNFKLVLGCICCAYLQDVCWLIPTEQPAQCSHSPYLILFTQNICPYLIVIYIC